MKGTTKAHLALLGANVIYGANYTVAKDVMPDYIQPSGFILLRVTGAVLLFWMIHPLFVKEKVARLDLLKLALCGLFGVAINQLMFFEGLNITTPINAAIIMTSNPILVLIAAGILLKERISASRITGILLGMAGAILILAFKDDFSIGSDTILGDLMVLINAASYGVYLVLVKSLMTKYHPITVVKWVFLFGLIYILPFGWSELSEVNWQGFTPGIWWSVAYVVIGTTFMAYFLNVYALKRVSPSVVSTYIYLQPLLATIVALMFGKDSLDWIKGLSAVLIFAGVYLVSRSVN